MPQRRTCLSWADGVSITKGEPRLRRLPRSNIQYCLSCLAFAQFRLHEAPCAAPAALRMSSAGLHS